MLVAVYLKCGSAFTEKILVFHHQLIGQEIKPTN
jgi:hypothetical protein